MDWAFMTRAITRPRISWSFNQHLRILALKGDALASGLQPTTGNKIKVFVGVKQFVPQVVRDIRAAQKQINITMYAMRPGPTGGTEDAIVSALIERAHAGIPITVQLDQFGSNLLKPGDSKRASEAMVMRMRNAGIDVRIKPTQLGNAGLNDARFAVDHRKLIEIDGKISYQGGINLVDAWNSWHDVMARIEGPGAAQVGALLVGRWRDIGGTVTERRLQILQQGFNTPVSDATAAVQQLSNGSERRRELTDTYLDLVNSATTTLRVAAPYLASEELLGAIVAAAKRGVHVEVLLPPKAGEFQDVLTDPLRKAWGADLIKAGAKVIQLPSFSHAKLLIADNKALVGSFNLDDGSERRNYEASFVSDDPDVWQQVNTVFDKQVAAGNEVDSPPASWNTLSWLRNLLDFEY